MCHPNRVGSLPVPGSYEVKTAVNLKYREYSPESSGPSKRVAIITDIYGCNEFYQSFATYFTTHGWTSYLMDLFSDLGELKEITREAAFERRHKLRDGETVDRLEQFLKINEIDAVIGFCIGGNFVFELARRNVKPKLVAYYPFPAGLPNEDGLTPPIEYVQKLEKPVTALVGDSDDSSGRETIAELARISDSNPALDVHVYAKSGHGFLAHLDSDDEQLKQNAEDALAVNLQVISA